MSTTTTIGATAQQFSIISNVIPTFVPSVVQTEGSANLGSASTGPFPAGIARNTNLIVTPGVAGATYTLPTAQSLLAAYPQLTGVTGGVLFFNILNRGSGVATITAPAGAGQLPVPATGNTVAAAGTGSAGGASPAVRTICLEWGQVNGTSGLNGTTGGYFVY